MVENDAGWLPHFCFRMDHAWKRHRWSLEIGALDRLPSEYVSENCIWATFQDDSSLRYVIDAVNLERIMWASDFPHGDGTYPTFARGLRGCDRGNDGRAETGHRLRQRDRPSTESECGCALIQWIRVRALSLSTRPYGGRSSS